MNDFVNVIDREHYLALVKLSAVELKDVDLNQYSDYYYSLYNVRGTLAVCGIHEQKNGIRQVNGLVSFQKGKGKELLNFIKGKYIRLNCTQELYDKFYSKLGFNVYLKLSDNYLECMKEEKDE